ncbi:uncharacterized protein THITE_2092033 [Thermothielavioides terrestris NRRL 8126]|uniref:Rhodopsin domain-containing protein n=1 Tax=Thermothielavioides terrestris (strain ATCC 38088 / NRRL 8126) TaxID=578455 RepID=G2RC93_THETT|nr:uncharacterized protein THITE_2092033 [Thermothielavioides terrestris NRRL 8126]AEO70528.1 hypothetical protein THITE_2092033 [Thermothielavioides terrestris NRRL 8126]
MAEFSDTDLCAIPLGKPPEGQVSNFVDPPSLSRINIVINGTVMASTFLIVAGRLFVNRMMKMLTWSDYLALMALVLSLTEASLMLTQLRLARHAWDIPVCWRLGNATKIYFARACLVITATALAKAAILLLFNQMFTVERRAHVAILAGLVVNGVLFLLGIAFESYDVVPAPGQTWDQAALSDKSDRFSTWAIATGVLTLLLDIYIFVLPVPFIARLNWSTRQRLKALAMFSTGLLAVVTSLTSLVYRVRMMEEEQSDMTWYAALVLMCIVVEVHIAIIVSSMPGFAKFMRVYLGGTMTGSSRAAGGDCEKNKPRTRGERYTEMRESWLFKTTGTATAMAKADDTADAAVVPGMRPAPALSGVDAGADSSH